MELPRYDGDKKWLQYAVEKAMPREYKVGRNTYLGINILNAEFWRAVSQEITWGQAIKNAFKYALYYIESKR